MLFVKVVAKLVVGTLNELFSTFFILDFPSFQVHVPLL